MLTAEESRVLVVDDEEPGLHLLDRFFAAMDDILEIGRQFAD